MRGYRKVDDELVHLRDIIERVVALERQGERFDGRILKIEEVSDQI